MRVVFDKESLLRAVQNLQSVAAAKNTLPILANVLLDASEEGIVMAATDLEVGIRLNVAGAVEETGVLTIPARKLGELVRELPDEEVRLETSGNNQIRIECGPVFYRMFGLPADEFPKMASVGDDYFTMDTGVVRKMIQRTKYAASAGETQYFLNGVYFHLLPEGVRMVATDSHRLAMASVDVPGLVEKEKGVIIPSKAVEEFIKNFGDEGEIRVRVQDNQILFADDHATLSSRLVDGEYPAYRQIVPKENPIRLEADRVALLTAVRRVSLFANPKTLSVRMKITETSMVVSASTADFGEARQELEVECSEPIEIGFNARFVMDAISVVDVETVRFEFKDPLSAAVVRPSEGDEYLCLIMPVRPE